MCPDGKYSESYVHLRSQTTVRLPEMFLKRHNLANFSDFYLCQEVFKCQEVFNQHGLNFRNVAPLPLK